MKMETAYEDLYDNPATLTESEMSWFETICRQCTEAVELEEDIPIYSMNHSRLKGKSKEAYGIIWKAEDQTYITIDTYFIHECYESVFHNAWNVTFETLEHVMNLHIFSTGGMASGIQRRRKNCMHESKITWKKAGKYFYSLLFSYVPQHGGGADHFQVIKLLCF